jgi:hypothetical protein
VSLLVFGFFPKLLTEKIKPVTEQIVNMATLNRGAAVAVKSGATVPLIPALTRSEGDRENRRQSVVETGVVGIPIADQQ